MKRSNTRKPAPVPQSRAVPTRIMFAISIALSVTAIILSLISLTAKAPQTPTVQSVPRVTLSPDEAAQYEVTSAAAPVDADGVRLLADGELTFTQDKLVALAAAYDQTHDTGFISSANYNDDNSLTLVTEWFAGTLQVNPTVPFTITLNAQSTQSFPIELAVGSTLANGAVQSTGLLSVIGAGEAEHSGTLPANSSDRLHPPLLVGHL